METQNSENQKSHQSNSGMQACIDSCLECYQSCTKSIQKCLSAGGKHAEASHVSLLISCARICNTSAELMMLGTKAHLETCGACAAICEMCAADCEQLGTDMKDCGNACRRCQESCENIAAN